MVEDYELYKIAAKECEKSYDVFESCGHTQWSLTLRIFNGKTSQWLNIPGTNELGDMVSNLVLLSENGIKLGAYLAAHTIKENIRINPNLDLYITGHSLGGATAIAFMREFGAKLKIKHCIVFAPARCLRYFRWFKTFSRKMKNTTMFRDPDDAVSDLLGFFNFGLPICHTVKAKKDHLFYSIGDHAMSKWVKFVNLMIYRKK